MIRAATDCGAGTKLLRVYRGGERFSGQVPEFGLRGVLNELRQI